MTQFIFEFVSFEKERQNLEGDWANYLYIIQVDQ